MHFKKQQHLIDQIINHETQIHFAKSGGHGGQNVNKRQTKAELFRNFAESPSLQELESSDTYLKKIRNHQGVDGFYQTTKSGQLHINASTQRYQLRNKEEVIHKFKQILHELFSETADRIPTKLPRHAIAKRKRNKHYHSEKKSYRKKVKHH